MTFTDTLVFKVFDQWAFEGIQPSEPNNVIANYLIGKCPELCYHKYDDVVRSVALWKDKEFGN